MEDAFQTSKECVSEPCFLSPLIFLPSWLITASLLLKKCDSHTETCRALHDIAHRAYTTIWSSSEKSKNSCYTVTWTVTLIFYGKLLQMCRYTYIQLVPWNRFPFGKTSMLLVFLLVCISGWLTFNWLSVCSPEVRILMNAREDLGLIVFPHHWKWPLSAVGELQSIVWTIAGWTHTDRWWEWWVSEKERVREGENKMGEIKER